ncbi:MAG: phosphate acetyltransferase [Candidimonas sp.]|nr:phosphate acetyltransferase [Candidimonas sp.]
MDLLERIKARARGAPQRIVLCEGNDARVLAAGARAAADGMARIVVVGKQAAIEATAAEHGLDTAQLELVDPETAALRPQLQQTLLALRAKRGMTPDMAAAAVLDPLTFAMLMLRADLADGSVSGAVYSTADVVRAAIQIVGPKPGSPLVSSFFLMLRDEPFHSNIQAMIFSDCGLVIDPDEEQLAHITLAAADSALALLNTEPKVAMLSFSTNGSATHRHVDKVRNAAQRVHALRPELAVDGDVQLDAAVVPEIAARKLAATRVSGQANVLIFPNLDAANIAYKLTERLGHATAIGPLLQGLAKPANDLSRGCSSEDVYNVIAVTAVQAQALIPDARLDETAPSA